MQPNPNHKNNHWSQNATLVSKWDLRGNLSGILPPWLWLAVAVAVAVAVGAAAAAAAAAAVAVAVSVAVVVAGFTKQGMRFQRS